MHSNCCFRAPINLHVHYISMGDWNLQEWKMTDHQKTGGGLEFAGLENDERNRRDGK